MLAIFVNFENIFSECLSGHFGVDCSKSCSGHCMNNEPCDHITGVCPRGCQDGYNGTFCNACKINVI